MNEAALERAQLEVTKSARRLEEALDRFEKSLEKVTEQPRKLVSGFAKRKAKEAVEFIEEQRSEVENSLAGTLKSVEHILEDSAKNIISESKIRARSVIHDVFNALDNEKGKILIGTLVLGCSLGAFLTSPRRFRR